MNEKTWYTFESKLPKLGDDIEIDAESWDGGRIVYAGKVISEPRRPNASDTLVMGTASDNVWLLSCENAVGAIAKSSYKYRLV